MMREETMNQKVRGMGEEAEKEDSGEVGTDLMRRAGSSLTRLAPGRHCIRSLIGIGIGSDARVPLVDLGSEKERTGRRSRWLLMRLQTRGNSSPCLR